jgi:hypothetical protein
MVLGSTLMQAPAMGFGFFTCRRGGDGGSSLGDQKLIPGIPLRGSGGADARERRKVADLEEDNDAIVCGNKMVRFGGGGRPALQRAMTSS